MAHFFARLTPKRPDFPANMTAEEADVMKRHAAFLTEQLGRGALVVAGPVLAPNGAFGMAVVEGDSQDGVVALLASDPANAIGHYDVAPMASAIARPAP